MAFTKDQHARSCVADAIDMLEHAKTDEQRESAVAPACELLVEAIIMLGSDPQQWTDDYPTAVDLARSSPASRA